MNLVIDVVTEVTESLIFLLSLGRVLRTGAVGTEENGWLRKRPHCSPLARLQRLHGPQVFNIPFVAGSGVTHRRGWD